MDPNTQFGMVAGDEAIKDCGINLETTNKDSVGVIWGSGIGGLKTFQSEAIAYGKEMAPLVLIRFSYLK